MAFIDWDESLSVGVDEIDEQHKRLIEMVNDLHTTCTLDGEPDAVSRVVQEFVRYTRLHFATEEDYMEDLDYPDRDKHVREHKECSLKAVEFFTQYVAQPDCEFGARILDYLKDWILRHLMETDKAFGQFLKAKGKS